ncbi:ABC transporter ATP-binding protein [Enterococcus sp. HY326]|uniref:ABC transporter ATP-binding protein n=1 Tax=Enterococcus sp. HY326 TaxID=2971265 RepID=UPI00223EC888|nr:ABC transporter ATP-binding protein [Enterococcus sp. HY326]
MKIIQTQHLSKVYKNGSGITDINFTLEQGEICGLIGKNGAGKSTLFKCLAGRTAATEGSFQLFESSNLTGKRHKMSFLIETPAFFDDFTATQNLEYFRRQRGITNQNRVAEVIEIVGLSDARKKIFAEYSLGMQQRLGIALALLASPDCLVLDEPINGLDAQGINDFRRLLKRLNQEQQITILISSHILAELELLANRFVFLHQGKLVEDLSQADLLTKTRKSLQLQVDNPSQAVQILERSYSDIRYQVLPDNWLVLENHLEESGTINRLLSQGNITVEEMHKSGGSLEDYFLDLVEEEK